MLFIIYNFFVYFVFIVYILKFFLMNTFLINTNNVFNDFIKTTFVIFNVNKSFISLFVNKFFSNFFDMIIIQQFTFLTNEFQNFRIIDRTKIFIFLFCTISYVPKNNFVKKNLIFLNNHLINSLISHYFKINLLKTNFSFVEFFFQNNSNFDFLSIKFVLITQKYEYFTYANNVEFISIYKQLKYSFRVRI